MCCLSASEFHVPPARLSIAGNPKGKHAGGLSFATFSLAIKEKILAQEGRKTQINSGTRTKNTPTLLITIIPNRFNSIPALTSRALPMHGCTAKPAMLAQIVLS